MEAVTVLTFLYVISACINYYMTRENGKLRQIIEDQRKQIEEQDALIDVLEELTDAYREQENVIFYSPN